MNCIPGLTISEPARRPPRSRSLLAAALLLVSCTACGAPPSEEASPASPLTYRIEYRVIPDAAAGSVRVTLELEQERALLRELRFRRDARVSNIAGDGDLVEAAGLTTWRPPLRGGSLSWQVQIAHRRNGDGYDAWLGPDWGLFRAEDIIPRAATRTLKSAKSETSLVVDLASGWSVVTQYPGKDGRFEIGNPERRFDQPSGWIVMGDLGVRRDTIAGTRVAVAGPTGQSARRLDMLAMLHWTLPELARVVPELPPRLTIVSAGDPMWRGGLSAPQSMFLHADRPLISENATSTLLHELLHISLGITADEGYDWIVEGLAEYYSLELLKRSGTISGSRYEQARTKLANWSAEADSLCAPVSSGATTALAVTVLAALDKEIRAIGKDAASLDEVTQALSRLDTKIDLAALRTLAEEIAGSKLDTLHIDSLPGCRTIDPD